MPFVRVSWFRGRDETIKAEVAADITRSIARHAGIDAASIYVLFEDVAPQDWAVGGTLVERSAADDDRSGTPSRCGPPVGGDRPEA